MNSPSHFDLIVIGSGSAGSSCWFQARRLGKSVAVFDGGVLGGECPTFACVPTKALLHAADIYGSAKNGARFGIDARDLRYDYARVRDWKDDVVSRTGAALGTKPYEEMDVTLVQEYARFVAPDAIEAGGRRYTADYFLIATGASQAVPEIGGLDESGYITFKEAIDLGTVPESIFILGGGAVGCEFTQLFSTFGAKVTIADRNDALMHGEDHETGELIAQLFRERGVEVLLSTTMSRVAREGTRKRVTYERDGVSNSVLVDEVLIAAGKRPNVNLNLEAAGIAYDERKGVTVDEHLRTSNERVYAAGDVAGPWRFTHAAGYQGALACDNMFGQRRSIDYRAMPRCAFTSPEVACVGLTEMDAREKGLDIRVGRVGIDASDRALTSDDMNGFVKVITDPAGRLLGGAIVCARAGEVVHELALAIQLGATAAQVASTIHAFPTYSEALCAACAEVAL